MHIKTICASSSTIKGALPPSSIEQLTIRSLAFASRTRPTSVEPVKDNLLTRLSLKIRLDISPERLDGNTLTTPAGTPASSSNPARASAVSGVSEAGFNMTVQPAANAGAIFLVPIAAGKFHGVIRSDTPTGL
jgi:hypothetical protein